MSESSSKPCILIPEKISEEGLSLLRPHCDLSFVPVSDLHTHLQDSSTPLYTALIVRSETKVTADFLSQPALKSLRVIARAGVGVDNIDVNAATRNGVIVLNSPSGNIGAAAEHTIALLMSVARNVSNAGSSLKQGKWERSKFVGVEVNGKTLGVIGLGKVGLNVSRMAIGLGMKVIAVDPYTSPSIASANNVTLTSLQTVLTTCDFLTIHTPLIASTRGMISTEELSGMKKGSRILNVARGGMIDEQALLDALESGHIAGAGLDVFQSEPPTEGSISQKLIAHPKVVATPHLGASTVEAQENVAIDVCEQVTDIVVHNGLPRAAVNAPIILPDEFRRLQPYVKLVEKMGHLFIQHFKPTNQYELIYEGEIANVNTTKPLFASLVKGLTQGVSEVTNVVNIVNAGMIAKERGLVVNELQVHTPNRNGATSYSSLVTLKASSPSGSGEEQIISGYSSSESELIIIRLGKFSTSFRPEGSLLFIHNFDSPGKIGAVGMVLGEAGVNIRYMSVAPAMFSEKEKEGGGSEPNNVEGGGEALMILGVSRVVEGDVLKKLAEQEGILDAACLEL